MYLLPNKQAKIPLLPALASYAFFVAGALAMASWLGMGEAALPLMATVFVGLIPSFVIYPSILHLFNSILTGLSPLIEQSLIFLGFAFSGLLVSIYVLMEQGVGMFDRGFATVAIVFVALPLELGWIVFLLVTHFLARVGKHLRSGGIRRSR